MTREVGLSQVAEHWSPVGIRRGLKDAPMEWLEENCNGIYAVDYTNGNVVYLSDEADAIAFKMWAEHAELMTPEELNEVLIPLIRRVMPSLLAYDLCGVQPMTGPTGQIFALKPRYAKSDTDDESL